MVKERRKKKPEEEGKEGLGKKEQQNLMELQHNKQQQKMVASENKENKSKEFKTDKGKGNDENEENGGHKIIEGKKDNEKPPSPPDVVVMRVLMHCEGCAKKVRVSLKGLEGVEDVRTDCKTNTVQVKGRKAAQDPKKVADRIYRKSGKRAEIISPVPIPVPMPVPVPVIVPVVGTVETRDKKNEGETHKIESKKEAQGIMVVLKIHMHCEACSEAIRNRILRLREVQEVVTDLKASQVTVKGDFDPICLVRYIYNRTGKKAVVVKQEPIFGADITPTNPKLDTDSKFEKEEEKQSQVEKTEKENEESKDKEMIGGAPMTTVVTVADPVTGTAGMIGRGDQYNYYYPRYPVEYTYAYPPQMFSDENPNACIVM
ncbi:hypothetical protein LUZ60_013782 [Juncus effusus]|nr:hypothetical protein LUZ60_013782 [Juncus effusus]